MLYHIVYKSFARRKNYDNTYYNSNIYSSSRVEKKYVIKRIPLKYLHVNDPGHTHPPISTYPNYWETSQRWLNLRITEKKW